MSHYFDTSVPVAYTARSLEHQGEKMLRKAVSLCVHKERFPATLFFVVEVVKGICYPIQVL